MSCFWPLFFLILVLLGLSRLARGRNLDDPSTEDMTAALQAIQIRDREYCTERPDQSSPVFALRELRTYIESPEAPPGAPYASLFRYYVDSDAPPDPPLGPDAPEPNPWRGVSAETAFKTLTYALHMVPYVTPGRPTPAPTHTYEIILARDKDYSGASEEAVTPRPNGLDYNANTLFFDQRSGDYEHPIIIRAEGRDSDYFDEAGNVIQPDRRPRLHFRLNLRSLQYVYLKNIRVCIESNIFGDQDAVQCQTIPAPDDAYGMPGALCTHHILLRGCEIDGGWRPRAGLASSSAEVLKVNQCQHVFVERCQIHGAQGDGKNAIDFFAVQYGHIVDCDLYDVEQDWCLYVKGGSAYIRIEGNRIHDAVKGFSAGEGADCEKMIRPWWHYEAYAVQFVNNLVYDTKDRMGGHEQGGYGTAIGLAGAYDTLIAYNTVYNFGTQGTQVINLGFGLRDCGPHNVRRDGDIVAETYTEKCALRISEGAWATTSASLPGVSLIPNRHVSVYYNVLLVDNASGGFNIFNIEPDSLAFAGTDGGAVNAMNLPSPLSVVDDTFDIKGNFFGVAGVGDVTGQVWFANTGSLDQAAFVSNYRTNNRVTDQPPQINTDRTDVASFLRPADRSSNILTPGIMARIPAPPAPWLGDSGLAIPRRRLPPPWGSREYFQPCERSDDRPVPWATFHDIYLDYDKNCRARTRFNWPDDQRDHPVNDESGFFLPGARTRPLP